MEKKNFFKTVASLVTVLFKTALYSCTYFVFDKKISFSAFLKLIQLRHVKSRQVETYKGSCYNKENG